MQTIKPQPQFRYLDTRPKQKQIAEGKLSFTSLNIAFLDRYIEIERQNRILLEKMTNILTVGSNKND